MEKSAGESKPPSQTLNDQALILISLECWVVSQIPKTCLTLLLRISCENLLLGKTSFYKLPRILSKDLQIRVQSSL